MGRPRKRELLAYIGRELQQASTTAVVLSETVAAKVGLHPTDLEALGELASGRPSTAGDLARATGLTSGAVTRLIDRLVAAGLARRTADPLDRRRVVVELTSRANAILPFYAGMARATSAALSAYGERELALFREMVGRLNAVASEEVTNVRQMPSRPIGKSSLVGAREKVRRG